MFGLWKSKREKELEKMLIVQTVSLKMTARVIETFLINPDLLNNPTIRRAATEVVRNVDKMMGGDAPPKQFTN